MTIRFCNPERYGHGFVTRPVRFDLCKMLFAHPLLQLTVELTRGRESKRPPRRQASRERRSRRTKGRAIDSLSLRFLFRLQPYGQGTEMNFIETIFVPNLSQQSDQRPFYRSIRRRDNRGFNVFHQATERGGISHHAAAALYHYRFSTTGTAMYDACRSERNTRWVAR